jgi:hypothetical protein
MNKLWGMKSGSDTDAAELAAVLENAHPSRFCVVLKFNQAQSSWHRRAREKVVRIKEALTSSSLGLSEDFRIDYSR